MKRVRGTAICILLVLLLAAATFPAADGKRALALSNLVYGPDYPPFLQLLRWQGSKSVTFHATATDAGSYQYKRWWTPLPFASPLYTLVSRQDESGGVWTTSSSYDLYTTDRFPLRFAPRYLIYTQPVFEVQSDSPEIVSLAYSLTKNCQWESEAVTAVLKYVAGYIDYDVGLPGDALSVLHNGRGDCGGLASLTLALLKAAGIPCTGEAGWMMPPGIGVPFHAWVNVYYPSAGWVHIDPTTNSHFISCYHTIEDPGWWTACDPERVRPPGVTASAETYRSATVFLTTDYDSRLYSHLWLPTFHHETADYGPPPQPVIESVPGGEPSLCVIEKPHLYRGPNFAGGITGPGTAAWLEAAFDGRVMVSAAPSLVQNFGLCWAGIDYALISSAIGTHTYSLVIEDVLGRRSTATYDVRVTRRPRAALAQPTLASIRADAKIPLHWCLTQTPERFGTPSFTLFHRAGTEEWSPWRVTEKSGALYPGLRGETYRFRVTVIDERQVSGPISAARLLVVPFDDASLVRNRLWAKRSDRRRYCSTFIASGTRGAKATMSLRRTNEIALLATKRPDGGKAEVTFYYPGGYRKRAIDLYSPTLRYKQLVPVFTFYSHKSGSLKVLVLGKKSRASRGTVVELDGVSARR